MYFIISKNKKDKRYKYYTNEIFNKEEDATDYADRCFTKKIKWKIVEYTSEMIKKYWKQFIQMIRYCNDDVINNPNYLYIIYIGIKNDR